MKDGDIEFDKALARARQLQQARASSKDHSEVHSEDQRQDHSEDYSEVQRVCDEAGVDYGSEDLEPWKKVIVSIARGYVEKFVREAGHIFGNQTISLTTRTTSLQYPPPDDLQLAPTDSEAEMLAEGGR